MPESTATAKTIRDAWAEGYRAAMLATIGRQPTQPEAGAYFPADWEDHNPYRDDAHQQDAGPVVAALTAAEARVAALEAGITRLAEQAKQWEDQRSAGDGYPAVVPVRHADLRALTEKEALA